MKTIRFLSTIILVMFLCSLIPYDAAACFTLSVCSKETKAELKKAKDAAEQALAEAKEELQKLVSEKKSELLIRILKGMSGDSFPEQVGDAVGDRDLRLDDEIEAAKKAVDLAQKAYDAASKAVEDCQDELRHIKIMPPCGNYWHIINACDLINATTEERHLYAAYHSIQASCSVNITQDGKNVYCEVTGFFLCTPHQHQFPEPQGSGSNSGDQTPNCDDCIDGSSNCSNASAH